MTTEGTMKRWKEDGLTPETKIKTMEFDVHCTPDSDNFESCDDCIHYNGNLSDCINRMCIHALALYDCYEKKKPKITNLEKIKSLDADEMSKFLDDFRKKNKCCYCGYKNNGMCPGLWNDCASGLYKWLMQEVSD